MICLPLGSAGVAAVDIGHGLDHLDEGAVVPGAFNEGGAVFGGLLVGVLGMWAV